MSHSNSINTYSTIIAIALLSFVVLLSSAFIGPQSDVYAQTKQNTQTDTAATEVLSFDNEQQRSIYDDLILELRCPKCQNQNIADSNADIAQDLRKKVYEMALQDKSKHDIKQFMLARYGEFVLYKPQFSGKTLLLWLLPLVVLIFVAIFVIRIIRRNATYLNNEETTD